MAYVRSNTSWPFFRGVINLIAILGYCVAALVVIVGVVILTKGYDVGNLNYEAGKLGGFIILMILALGIVVAVSFWKEAALMIADIGDSITDANYREVMQ